MNDSDLSARADDWKAGRVNPKAQARNDGTLAGSSVWNKVFKKIWKILRVFHIGAPHPNPMTDPNGAAIYDNMDPINIPPLC